MSPRKHLDEARDAGLSLVVKLVQDCDAVRYAALIVDIFGRISLAVWKKSDQRTDSDVADRFSVACGEHWTGSIYSSESEDPDTDDDILTRTAWLEGTPLSDPRARITDRFRHHTAWRSLRMPTEPLWSLQEGPPIVAFHGFKGGVGRTTILASYALACARRGEKVSVVDVDLDAPGLGTLLAADDDGTTARWGTIDYLLEHAAPHPIDDYLHVVSREQLTGEGRIEVTPAGRLDDSYLPKLARVDLEIHGDISRHPLASLLRALRDRSPQRILLDGRAGLSPAAGLLLSGIAHFHVLIATSNRQSLAGLERVVRHLGYEAASRGEPQLECVVVQALVPEGIEAAAVSRDAFAAEVENIFRDGYYAVSTADDDSADDSVWSVDDLSNLVAPHVPVAVPYNASLAHYRSISDIAEILRRETNLAALHERIDQGVDRSDATGDENG